MRQSSNSRDSSPLPDSRRDEANDWKLSHSNSLCLLISTLISTFLKSNKCFHLLSLMFGTMLAYWRDISQPNCGREEVSINWDRKSQNAQSL
jgi:hypothetical protein